MRKLTIRARATEVSDAGVRRCPPEFDVWDSGGNTSCLYTENWGFARILRKEFGGGTTYERAGKLFAWQFTVSKSKIPFLRNLLVQVQTKNAEIESVENQRLTEVKNGESLVSAQKIEEAIVFEHHCNRSTIFGLRS